MAAPLGNTRVYLLVLNGPLEEALAGLTGEQAVVVARHFVPAHRTQLFYALLGVRRLRRRYRTRVERVVADCAGTGHVHVRGAPAWGLEQIGIVNVAEVVTRDPGAPLGIIT